MSFPTSQDWQNLFNSILENKESIKELRESTTELRESQNKAHKEAKEEMKELRKSQQETDRFIKETSREIKKSNEETNRKLDKVAKMIGGHVNNVGDVTEDFFFRGLSNHKSLGNIKFDEVKRNIGEKKEYDILMINGDSVAVISVKYKLHEGDVDQFIEKDLKDFKKSYQKYKKYKLYAGIATKYLNTDLENSIKQAGLFAITQSGKDIKILNEKKFKAKQF